MKYFIIFILILLIFVFGNCCYLSYEHFTNNNNITLLDMVMKERGITNNSIYIPRSYNSCEKDILAFENSNNKKLFLIDGCDWIGSKLALWELLQHKYGVNASKYMPTTFLLENKKDITMFPTHYYDNMKKNPKQMYVLKNYAQRQEGIKLTRDLNEILNGVKNGWYLVQDYIYNPYIIDQRKINFRYYLLVVCRNGKTEGYIHNAGFLYYTSEYYDANDMNFKKHITTGYIDRMVYKYNPLTLDDFRKHLEDKEKGSSKIWNKNAENLMHHVMVAISDKICKNNKLDNNIRFQLFGCDLAPSSDLNAMLMEINKGPDMDAKDERDKMVKLSVLRDIFKIIDPKTSTENMETQFVKIY